MRAAPPPPSSGFLSYLVLTATVAGAFVMVLEVVGSRLVGPFFGVSLFVWTSLITVTLLALALGYAAGGVLADRGGGPARLYWLVMAAGAATLMVPLFQAAVLSACAPLGLRAGTLLASLVLVGPSLFLLGCVSPFVIRLAAPATERLGRTVGLIYAASTLGSLGGTALTGFVLIAYVGVDGVFRLVGAGLVLLAAGYFLLFGRRRGAALALLALAALPGKDRLTSKVMANGTRVTEVMRRQGFYGTMQVVEYSYGSTRTRELILDGQPQGGIDVASGLSVYEYAYFMTYIPYAMNPSIRSCLVVGLGPGVVPAWYARAGARTDVVDINPDVLAAARAHFGFPPGQGVALEDARYFLRRPGPLYDVVVLDAFAGDTTPAHLLTVEALRLVRARLAEGGVLIMNVAGSLRRETLMTASLVRTLQAVFRTVEVHPAFDPAAGQGFGNLAVLAHDGVPGPLDLSRVRDFPVHPLAAPAVRGMLGRTFAFPPGTPALVLTDDYNPIDVRDRWLKEALRREILGGTDWDLLLRRPGPPRER